MDYNKIVAKLLEYSPKVIAAILILVVGWLLAKIFASAVRKISSKSKMDPTLGAFVANLTSAGILIFTFIAAIGKLGVQTTSFVALIGAAGLAVGLALQGSLANFAAGVLILIFRPFNVGDSIQAGGVTGKIHDIQIFTTVLLSPDNKKIIVPNAKINADVIINSTAMPTRRVDMVFSIAKTDDVIKAREIIKSVLDTEDKILKDPAPNIVVSELAGDNVNLSVQPYVNTADYSAVLYAVTEKVKIAFDTQLHA
ncbi:MAG TPA: mechanosensitive ion channel [Candidatus Cloacimonadota bacterium]|nr:mechanosensitive ion channel [Candidatus Cloacimonadota bacterium]HPT72414.1 mechanosensitive ion channel [Candidatus Cloacimonadota bacterium]